MILCVESRIKFGLTILLFLVCTQASIGQSLEKELLDQPIQQLKVEVDNIHLALSEIAYEYKVPIGLEVAQRGDEGPKIRIDIQNSSVRDVLNAIVEQDSKYEWKLIDGVVNVFPKVRRDELLESLLQTQAKQFIIKKGTSLWSIRQSITEIPEIKLKIEAVKVTPNHVAWNNSGFQEASPGFELNLTNATVREILNRIIRTSNTKYWIMNRYGENKEFIIINF